MTSLEFERILSASGPTMGHLVRPSDHKEPKKIAWLQCVGSRDTNKCGNTYCSSVCCMYAIKDAMIAKEHSGGNLDCAIFYMDIRSFGKDYELYYNRARDREQIRFMKSRIHSLTEDPETRDLILKFADENGNMQEEKFDMVVLSVGLEVPDSSVELAKRWASILTNTSLLKPILLHRSPHLVPVYLPAVFFRVPKTFRHRSLKPVPPPVWQVRKSPRPEARIPKRL
jgi:heterodisulfide reductase subunit A-like polyferredoxin